MKITYDPSVDAAYIYLAESIEPGGVKKTYMCDPVEVGTMVNLDMDSEGRIVGVEVLSASAHLPKNVLKHAVQI